MFEADGSKLQAPGGLVALSLEVERVALGERVVTLTRLPVVEVVAGLASEAGQRYEAGIGTQVPPDVPVVGFRDARHEVAS